MNEQHSFGGMKTADLELLVQRHEAKGATDRPLYLAAKQELARRATGQLSLEITLNHLRQYAAKGTFTTYGAVAAASGIEWRLARRPMPRHLEQVLEECWKREWPLLSALCVNATEVQTGELSGTSLDGFVAGVERVTGRRIDNSKAFLKQTQRECFEWARN
ncbi:MAG TPA: hypothetical protein VGH02_01715 [Rhizomicrobium sp.]|jgi:5-methylcytosine-specific restriction protein B